MYFDYDACYWQTDRPDGKCWVDYEYMPTGTILTAVELEEYNRPGDDYNIKLVKGGYLIYFRNLEDARKCIWLEEVKEHE